MKINWHKGHELQKTIGARGVQHFDNEEEWLAFRRTGVCATDVAAIIGHSDLKKRDDVLYEKVTGESPNSDYVNKFIFQPAKDIEHACIEKAVLDCIKDIEGIDSVDVYEQVCIARKIKGVLCIATIDAIVVYNPESKENYFGSSIVRNYILLEIKTTQSKKIKTYDDLPEDYRYQTDFQFLIFSKCIPLSMCNAKLYTCLFDINGSIMLSILTINKACLPSLEKEYSALLPSFKQFYDELRTGKAIYDEKKVEEVEVLPLPKDEEQELAYLDALYRFKVAEEELKQKKEDLLAGLADKCHYEGFRLSIRRTPVQGRIDYKKIPQLKSVDLNKYRSSMTFRTSIEDKG